MLAWMIGGLDAVPAVSLPLASPVPRPALTPKQARAALARRVLAARGMQDCVTYGFLARETAALFGETPDALRLENPTTIVRGDRVTHLVYDVSR